MSDVAIHYTRLPARTTVFRQRFVQRVDDCTITLMEHTELATPVHAGAQVILEPQAPVVWFTFDDAWHDIGRFHLADDTFTGCYANIITPVHFTTAHEWHTTDLFLDVWQAADGAVQLLDEDELARALDDGAIDASLAATARAEATRLIRLAETGAWPPPVVREWTLEHARGTLPGDAV